MRLGPGLGTGRYNFMHYLTYIEIREVGWTGSAFNRRGCFLYELLMNYLDYTHLCQTTISEGKILDPGQIIAILQFLNLN